MAILLEEMVFLMKSRDSGEEDADEDVNFQRREVSNTVAAITDNTVLAEAIDEDDDWDPTRGQALRSLQYNSEFSDFCSSTFGLAVNEAVQASRSHVTPQLTHVLLTQS